MRILFSLLFLVNIIYASVAVVSAFKGKANIYRDGQEISMYVGIEINKKDSITTFNNTKIQLIFKDNTRITIGKNSQFSVEDYFYDETKTSKSKARFRFTKGLFRTISGRIGKINKKQFKIHVRSATIGIRGTKFDVYVNPLYVKVGVYAGAVYFENNSEIVDVKTSHFFVFEYLKDKKIIKNGKFKESSEFDDDTDEIIKKEYTDDKEESTETTQKKVKTTDSKETTSKTNEEEVSDISDTEDEINDLIELENNIGETVQTADDGIDIPSSSAINADPNLIKEIMDNVDDLEYGYWQDTTQNNARVDTFIQGTLTPDAVIDSYISNSSQQAEYHGYVEAIITNPNGSTSTSNGSFVLISDFANESINGFFKVYSGDWEADINSGDLSSTGFTSNDITTGANSSVNGISGSLNGNYYGPNGNKVGASFNLSSTNNGSVEGVFGGVKQ